MRAEVSAIATVRSPRKDLTDDFWGAVDAQIVLADRFDEAAFYGLSDFSHVEVLFLMHQVDPAKVEKGARHPRERPDWPLVGIFGQRGKARPNRIGLTRATIVSVDGRVLTVRGLDAIDGTPVLDVKPWMDEFAPIGATRQPAWVTELMRDYFKD
ncbi:SAM-dependent methyltransferase [Candidatus Viadribacter manganicus]|uniref:tRNA-Thr(GGU) m(6)t(6)A37 methyltransferase TsaA n=1 Tax=Candidatus Viadribacter manganicus TaxID=1759059 RepID=A0A1B1AI09_9PROT|nr:SAM-dependent methyltransferase [Candidatus Viadribacter manganicus]ANP46199.1 tRNA-Thr(GGU) m(6)t(6)A37 methyltransferase TsaA [Candidatus Viadribacter manganicus]